jgi:hypothetical protein
MNSTFAWDIAVHYSAMASKNTSGHQGFRFVWQRERRVEEGHPARDPFPREAVTLTATREATASARGMSQASVDLVRRCIDTVNAGEFGPLLGLLDEVVADDAELRVRSAT